jgi:23S rRNA pseudouridine955/2504/2580 synthase
MNDIIKSREIKKTYLAVVHGAITPKSGELNFQLEKDSKENLVRVRNKSTSSSKTAITRYNTIAFSKDNKFSLLEIELITGRTHQIRASFAHIGHPLLGDGKYSVNKSDRAIGYKSQALCAYSVKFTGCKNRKTLGYLEGLEVSAKKPKFLEIF